MDEIIESKLPGVFFRNEWARIWAENTVCDNNKKASRAALDLLNADPIHDQILIIHPEDDQGDKEIPDGYDGLVIRWPRGTGTCILN